MRRRSRRAASARRARGTPADLLVVGLGNPGAEYERTRHNVGAEVVELLADRHGAKLRKGKERALVDEVVVGGKRLALAVPAHLHERLGRGGARRSCAATASTTRTSS